MFLTVAIGLSNEILTYLRASPNTIGKVEGNVGFAKKDNPSFEETVYLGERDALK